VLVLLMALICKVRLLVAADGMVHIPGFMKIGVGTQVILRFYLGTLRGCSVGTTVVSAPFM
jgi:hypothetical protein